MSQDSETSLVITSAGMLKPKQSTLVKKGVELANEILARAIALQSFQDSVLRGHLAPITALAWTPDGRYLISGSGDATVRIWDRASGIEVRRFESHLSAITAIALSY